MLSSEKDIDNESKTTEDEKDSFATYIGRVQLLYWVHIGVLSYCILQLLFFYKLSFLYNLSLEIVFVSTPILASLLFIKASIAVTAILSGILIKKLREIIKTAEHSTHGLKQYLLGLVIVINLVPNLVNLAISMVVVTVWILTNRSHRST